MRTRETLRHHSISFRLIRSRNESTYIKENSWTKKANITHFFSLIVPLQSTRGLYTCTCYRHIVSDDIYVFPFLRQIYHN